MIWVPCHIVKVRWAVEIGDTFEPEFDALPEQEQMEILALSVLLEQFGPQLGRPRVDTLNGSRHANMKELRFSAADGQWRRAFAFDPKRRANLLGAGAKSSGSENRSDLWLSTLRKTVKAMGGEVRIVAQFPDRAPVVLAHLSEEHPGRKSSRRRARRAAGP